MHELARLLGLTDASGPQYLFWSGFFSVVFSASIFGMVWRFLNCHESSCKRIGMYHVPGTPFRTCKVHHPAIDESKEISAAHIKRAHNKANNLL